jgi:uncharacterized protein (TIGR02145 family)
LIAFISLLATSASFAQNVGVGTNYPDVNLHVNGTFRITDGTEGDGKILTSDAEGLTSWQDPPPPPPVNYPSVWICCNPWMIKNLDVSTYRNGDPIPKVTDAAEWNALTTGAYCYYNNDSTTYAATYGKLYNWYAVNDPRGLAPEGWHIATTFEWTTLSTCLGGNSVAGGRLKELGTEHWNPPNSGATNVSGFTALPGGYRWDIGPFELIGYEGYWWTATENTISHADLFLLQYNSVALNTYQIFNKHWGLSVRCVKD